jgi:hypothetical protein
VSPGDGWTVEVFLLLSLRSISIAGLSFRGLDWNHLESSIVCTYIMAPSNDIVYRTHSATEDSIEKPTFEDGDKALEFLRGEAQEGETDLVDEKRLVRKIDFMIV